MSESIVNVMKSNSFEATLDAVYPHICEASVAKALDGFSPALASDKTLTWLATVARRMIAMSTIANKFRPQELSESIVRDNILDQSERAADLLRRIYSNSPNISKILFNYSAKRMSDLNGVVNPTDSEFEYNMYLNSIQALDWLSKFLSDVASSIDTPKRGWRLKRESQQRVLTARYIAAVFETAFDQAVTVNNWPSEDSKPSAFIDFYQRMEKLAFGKNNYTNLTADLKKARAEHEKGAIPIEDWLTTGIL